MPLEEVPPLLRVQSNLSPPTLDQNQPLPVSKLSSLPGCGAGAVGVGVGGGAVGVGVGRGVGAGVGLGPGVGGSVLTPT